MKHLLLNIFFLVLFFSCANKKEDTNTAYPLQVRIDDLSWNQMHSTKTKNPLIISIKKDKISNKTLAVTLDIKNDNPLMEDSFIKSAFIDIHKAREPQIHGQGGHQDGAHHDMPDGFQGRMVLGKTGGNGSFLFEDGALKLRNRPFPKDGSVFWESISGKYKIEIGTLNANREDKRWIFFLEIME